IVAAAFAIGAAAGTMFSPARRAVAEVHATDGNEHPANDQAIPVIGGEEEVAPDTSAATAVGQVSEQPAQVDALIQAVTDLPVSEAAPMVAQLSDTEAVAVLKGQSLARASQILEAMPRETAARLSRLLLLAR